MIRKYYTRVKLTQIIMDLIYLREEMDRDGHTDKGTLRSIQQAINDLTYYLQFLPKTPNND